MTLADTNVWLALTLSKHQFHRVARDWFDAQTAKSSVLFCRATQQSFLRLLTTDAMMRPYGIPPLTNAAAWSVYESLSSDRRVAWMAEPPASDVDAKWRRFAARDLASPKLWMDAYLAALASAGGHRVATTDKAFTQFKGLDVVLLSPAMTTRE